MRDNSSNQLFRIAGWCAYGSGVTFIIAWIPLVTLLTFGANIPYLNDTAAIVQYLLALPITFALHRLVQPRAPVLSRVAMLSGIVGIFGVAVLQLIWIFDLLQSWTTYIILFMTIFLMIGLWLVITGYQGRSTGRLPHSLLMSILAAMYIGYPVWAFWLGRLLLSDRCAVSGPSMKGEINMKAWLTTLDGAVTLSFPDHAVQRRASRCIPP